MTVKKRHIYYISGFDPRGVAFYRRLYFTEAQKQADIGGLPLKFGERKKVSSFSSSWKIESQVGGQTVNTTYEFLHWDDIVREHWTRNEARILFNYLKAIWIYAQRGIIKRTFQASLTPFLVFIFPLIVLSIITCLAMSSTFIFPTIASFWGLPIWIGWCVAGASFIGIMQIGRVIEKRFNSYWLLRLYSFSVKQGLGKLPNLEARLDQFAEHIVNQTTPEVDEILIVGHSTGTIMATSVLGRALELQPNWLQGSKAKLSLLTLGQCIPIVSMLPEAKYYRDNLVKLNQSDSVNWIDFTAPTDGACFAFVDPLTVSGLPQSDLQQPKPKLLSPRFARLFSPQSYAKIKRNWYRNHFQYLMSSERADGYDYFAITAGALTLGDRYQSHSSVQHYKRPGLFR